MFSIVQNISSALRPASNDHTYDRKGGKNQHGQGRNDYSAHDDKGLYEAHETGSVMQVRSVLLFLEDYLENQLLPYKVSLEKDDKDKSDFVNKWRGPDAANGNGDANNPYNAAKVYAHVSKGVNVNARRLEGKPRNLSEELRDVYALIRRLRSLEERGVSSIRVPHDIPFLRGIRYAVDSLIDV